MRLSLEAFEHQVNQGIVAPGYLLVANAPVLLQEARQRVKKNLQQHGFADCRIWEVDANVDWEQLEYANQHVDLFQPRTVIELRCQPTLSEATAKKLQAYVAQFTKTGSSDCIMLISCPQGLMTLQKATWFQNLSRTFSIISVDVPAPMQFPAWLKHRLQAEQLTATPEGLLYLAKLTENNLTAAIHVIQKLKLVYGQSSDPLNREHIQPVVDDHAQFELFELVDAALKGQADRCIQILYYLEEQNTAPALVLGYVLKIVRLLTALRYGLDHHKPLPLLFKDNRIWPKQQAAYKQAVDRLTRHDLQSIFNVAHQLDRCIKGVEKGSNWLLLHTLLFKIAGVSLVMPHH